MSGKASNAWEFFEDFDVKHGNLLDSSCTVTLKNVLNDETSTKFLLLFHLKARDVKFYNYRYNQYIAFNGLC